jgi:hypothetical protein
MCSPPVAADKEPALSLLAPKLGLPEDAAAQADAAMAKLLAEEDADLIRGVTMATKSKPKLGKKAKKKAAHAKAVAAANAPADAEPVLVENGGGGGTPLKPTATCFNAACTSKKASSSKPQLQRCSACRLAVYCSAECQKAHWPQHRPHCTNSQKAPTSKAAVMDSEPVAAVRKAKGTQNTPYVHVAPTTITGTGTGTPTTGGSCSVCLTAPTTHVFVPCGHKCACQPCAVTIASTEKKLCPLCRSPFQMACQVYE